jgi:hypothetical protein
MSVACYNFAALGCLLRLVVVGYLSPNYLLDLLSSNFMLLSKFDFRLFLLRVRLSFRLFLTRRRQLMAKPTMESGAKIASRIRLR